MASYDFTTTENPLGGSWTSITSFDDLQATGGEVTNQTDSSAAAMYWSGSAESSQLVSTAATAEDGGPALFNSAGQGYILTRSGNNVAMYRVNTSSSYTLLAGSGFEEFAQNEVLRIYRDGDDVVAEVDSVEFIRNTDTTYTGLSAAIHIFSGSYTGDDWTDGASGGGGALHAGSLSLLGVGR